MPLHDIMPAGEVHLHLSDDPLIVSPELLAAYEVMLSEEEIARRNRFRFERHRHQFLVSRALLRKTLSSYRPDVEPAAWRFGTNAFGRPHILGAGAGDFDFNLSHTHSRIVLAVSQTPSPGVDIEWRARPDPFADIATQFFASVEVEALKALPAEAQRRRFFDLWTLKEAYIKARGLGLSIPLKDFAMHFPAGERPCLRFAEGGADEVSGWQFWSIFAGTDYSLSLALAGHARVRLFQCIPLMETREVECRLLFGSQSYATFD